jgi:capsular polysaccharide biosynthesis protein
MDFLDLWYAITSRKLIIFLVVLGFGLFGAFLASVLPHQYLGEVTVSVVASKTTPTSSNVATTPTADLNQPFTVEEITGLIQGRAFIYKFIQENQLLPVLFEKDWNKDKMRWEPSRMHRWTYGDSISIWDGFTKFSDILDVDTDEETNLTTISVKWTDAKLAAEWANKMVDLLNAQVREQAIKESEAILSQLQERLNKTSALELRLALYGLMETELAKITSAKVHPEFAMKVLDSAVIPDDQAIPYFQLIIITVSLFLGVVIALALVLLLHTLAKSKARRSGNQDTRSDRGRRSAAA